MSVTVPAQISPVETREELLYLLTRASELEHDLACSYLYAGYSIKMRPEEGGVTHDELIAIRHWKSKIAGVALTSVLSAGLAVSQNRSNNSVLQYPSTGEVIGASVGQSASQLGQELTQRNFNRQPTLVIRSGQKFLVYVNKDIVFPSPYEPHY